MKINKIIIALLIAILFSVETKAQNNALSISVNTMISNYLALKNALVNSNGTDAESKAKDLLASISNVSEKDMTAKQAALWNSYSAKLQYDSRHISEVSFVHHQREHFASLSNNLYAVLKVFKVNKTILYRQYCVMGKQYFLSDTQTGKDPYMAMEHCTRVAETLPAAK